MKIIEIIALVVIAILFSAIIIVIFEGILLGIFSLICYYRDNINRPWKKKLFVFKEFLWVGFTIFFIITANDFYKGLKFGDMIKFFITVRLVLFSVEIIVRMLFLDEEGYNRKGYDKDGYNSKGYDKNGLNKYTGTKYNKAGYDKNGYDKNGYDKDGLYRYTRTKYNIEGYDREGYNMEGYDVKGYNKDGYDKRGYNKKGRSRGGYNKKTGTKYDKDGYDISGYDVKGYNKDGYDKRGYDKDGYDKYGYSRDGFKKDGYNILGYDKDGYDRDGFNKKGYDKGGYDKDGYDWDGWNKKGINKETGTKYDKSGYDKDGWNKEGWNEGGYNKFTDSLFDEKGYDVEGYDNRGYNKKGWNRLGCNKETGTEYDKYGYDKDGWNKKGWNKKGINKETGTEFNEDGYDKKGYYKYKRTKSIKICSIASGSNGNCYYIGNDSEAILIDDGISYKQLSSRMRESGLDINSVKGIFISHEHTDHIKGLAVFHKNHPYVPIFFNEVAYNSVSSSNDPGAYRGGIVNLEEGVINLLGFKIYSFKKKHDSRYPLSFRVEYNGISIGIFTDIGESCAIFRNHFSKCNAVFLESNHDVTMLRNGSYPDDLKERVYQNHFSNDNAYDMLKKYANPKLQVVILSHISKDNNSHSEISDKFGEFNKKYKIEIASRYYAGNVYDIK